MNKLAINKLVVNKLNKLIILLPFVIFALSACSKMDMFKIDNYEGPNASLNGGIRDIVTGELVETDITNGSRLQLQELGYPTGLLTRVVKQNGEYRDDLFFAGKYSIDFNQCNFFPFKIEEIEVKQGNNTVDFKVTPYIRVKNVSITKDGNDAIVATFSLEAGREDVRVNNVRLFMHTDIYVGDAVTSYTFAPGTGFSQNPGNIAIDPATVYTLRLDLTNATNKALFKYKRNYYFRVGALATVPNPQDGKAVGTIRRNYAPYQIINFSLPQ